jgi:hypothetical protein
MERDKDINEELQVIKKVIKEKELRPEFAMVLEREDIPTQEKIMELIVEAFKRLTLVNAVFKDPDLFKLEGSHLSGVEIMVEEIYTLIDAAVDLHFKTN